MLGTAWVCRCDIFTVEAEQLVAALGRHIVFWNRFLR